ncbi:MAG TPA: hypothetical protein VFF79_13030 [Conexibacter sp.]|jgi:hypothetical protein|nr:hypothetical protein [Conexibacter sp.]
MSGPRTEPATIAVLREACVGWLRGEYADRWLTAANLVNLAYNTGAFALEAQVTRRKVVAALAQAVKAGEVERETRNRYGHVTTFYSAAPSPRGGTS